MPVPPPGGRPTNAPITTADGRPMDLVMLEESGRNLKDTLKPGSTVTGRVIERFQGDSYLFTLRGRNLIAESKVPLLRDSVVRFAVLRTGDDGISLRLIDGSARDSATTTGQNQRLASLGLNDQPSARLVLQNFEDAGASLNRIRLQRAAADVAAQPPANQGLRAAAHAALARAGLPATPTLLGLAEQTLRPVLPNAAQTCQPATTTLPRTPVNFASSSAPNPSAAPPATTPGLSSTRTPPATSSTATTTSPQPNSGSPLPSTGTPTSAAGASNAAPATTPPATVSASLAGPSVPNASTSNPLGGTGTLNVPVLPDPSSGGRDASAAALQLAGVIPDLTAADTPHVRAAADASNHASTHAKADLTSTNERGSLITQLITMARVLEQAGDSQRTVVDQLHTAIRDTVAETIVPPANLDDFDLVLPLPLMNAGMPIPGRIAITRRKGGATNAASFVRIDLELANLGPLSIRMNAIEGAPISILLLATGHAIRSLEQQLTALTEDLETQNIEAHIRIDHLLDHGDRRE